MTKYKKFALVLFLPLSLFAALVWYFWPSESLFGARSSGTVPHPNLIYVAATVLLIILVVVVLSRPLQEVQFFHRNKRIVAYGFLLLALLPFVLLMLGIASSFFFSPYPDEKVATATVDGHTFSLYLTRDSCGAYWDCYLVEEIHHGTALHRVDFSEHREVSIKLLKEAAKTERFFEGPEDIVYELEKLQAISR